MAIRRYSLTDGELERLEILSDYTIILDGHIAGKADPMQLAAGQEVHLTDGSTLQIRFPKTSAGTYQTDDLIVMMNGRHLPERRPKKPRSTGSFFIFLGLAWLAMGGYILSGSINSFKTLAITQILGMLGGLIGVPLLLLALGFRAGQVAVARERLIQELESKARWQQEKTNSDLTGRAP